MSIAAHLSTAFSLILGQNRPSLYPIDLKEYLKSQDIETCDKVIKLANATFSLEDREGNFVGNGIAITNQHILTTAHCGNDENEIWIPGRIERLKADTIVNYAKTSNIDFKIMKFASAHFQPIQLDVVPNMGGRSLQIFYADNKRGSYSMMVRELTSIEIQNGCRSDITDIATNNGESGSPRMALHNGYVHAIHQGEGEGLKINDIFQVLLNAAKINGPMSQIALEILNNATFENLEMTYLNASTIALQKGDVNEEKKPLIKGSVTFSVDLDKAKTAETFEYNEIGNAGPGPRKIEIWKKGLSNAKVKFDIQPNPHNKKTYNKKQPQFYKTMAFALTESYLNRREKQKDGLQLYPNKLEIEFEGVTYVLTRQSDR